MFVVVPALSLVHECYIHYDGGSVFNSVVLLCSHMNLITSLLQCTIIVLFAVPLITFKTVTQGPWHKQLYTIISNLLHTL